MPSLRHVVLLAVALGGGCAKHLDRAPAGYAVIREHAIYNPYNDPPIQSTLDYTIRSIDGNPVTRETVPSWVDLQAGALVTAGTHRIRATVHPHWRPFRHAPVEVVFTVTVTSGKVYELVDDAKGRPTLIEYHPTR